MLLLLLLLAAVPTRLDLVNEVFRIPPADWRYVEIVARHAPVRVVCEFQVNGGQPVRVALVEPRELDHLRNGSEFTAMASTSRLEHGTMRKLLRRAGRYSLVIDNREAAHPSDVHLRVSLVEPGVSELPPERRVDGDRDQPRGLRRHSGLRLDQAPCSGTPLTIASGRSTEPIAGTSS